MNLKNYLITALFLIFLFLLTGCQSNTNNTSENFDNNESSEIEETQAPVLEDGMNLVDFISAPGDRIWFCGGGSFEDHSLILWGNTIIDTIYIQKGENVQIYKVNGEDLTYSDFSDMTDQEIIDKVETNSLYSNISFDLMPGIYKWVLKDTSNGKEFGLQEIDSTKKPGTEAFLDVLTYSNEQQQLYFYYQPGTSFKRCKSIESINQENNRTGRIVSGFIVSENDPVIYNTQSMVTPTDTYYSIDLSI